MASFGGFKFGASTSAPSSSHPPAVPSFSITGATPTGTTSGNTFSFGATHPAGQGSTGGGMFGAQQQQQPAGSSLFGNQQQQQQPQQNGQQAGGSSLFGGGTSMFGAKQSQLPTSGTGTGGTNMFGGSLFGGGQQPQAQQPQQTSLFGQSTSQQPQTSLFGQPTQQQQQQQQPQSSLFGQSTQQKPQTSLFGQSTQQQPQSSLFSSQSQPQPQQPQASTSNTPPSGITKSTKFTELPEPVQKVVEQLDGFFKQQKEMRSGVNIEELGRAIWQTSGDVRAANEVYSALAQGLTSLRASLNQLQAKVLSEEEDLRRIAEIWESYKAGDGRSGAVRLASHRDFPQDFFARAAGAMEERVVRYKKTIAQLNRVIISLASDNETPSPQAIAQTIQNHQNALLTLAAQLEDLQLRMNDLRGAFAESYRQRTNSMRDPFEVAREEKGLPPVRA